MSDKYMEGSGTCIKGGPIALFYAESTTRWL